MKVKSMRSVIMRWLLPVAALAMATVLLAAVAAGACRDSRGSRGQGNTPLPTVVLVHGAGPGRKSAAADVRAAWVLFGRRWSAQQRLQHRDRPLAARWRSGPLSEDPGGNRLRRLCGVL